MEAKFRTRRSLLRLTTPGKLLPGTLAAATLFVTGCPQRRVDIVKETITEPCKEPVAAAAPPSASLQLVALVTQGGARKAVVVGPAYTAVVGEGEPLGSDGRVNNILGDAVQASGADGRSFRLPLVTELAAPSAPSAPSAAPESPAPQQPTAPAAGAAPVAAASPDLELWRRSVLSGLNRGYGVPYEAALALSLALTVGGNPPADDALRALAWGGVAGLERVRLDRIELRDGTLRIDGGAPTAELVVALKQRLDGANPVITEIREAPAASRADGLVPFSFVLGTPLIRLADAVASGASVGTANASETLKGAGGAIAVDKALAGFEEQLKAKATGAALSNVEVVRDGATREDGFLGVVSFNVSAGGKLPAVVDFLKSIKPPRGNVGGRPILLDPIVVTKDSVQLTVHVPYSTEKADVRDPAPGQVFTPQLMNARWSAATVVPAAQLRDPF